MTLPGRARSVAGEGAAGDPGLQRSLFAATIQLDTMNAEQADVVRIEMSANVTIALYQASSATILPPEAIHAKPPAATVLVLDTRTGRPEVRNVAIGVVVPDEVELLSGIT